MKLPFWPTLLSVASLAGPLSAAPLPKAPLPAAQLPAAPAPAAPAPAAPAPAAPVSGTPSPASEISSIHIVVQSSGGTSRESRYEKSQKKALKILLSNNSVKPSNGLRVSYFYFGKVAKSRDITVLESGELSADLAGHGSAELNTPAYNTTFTQAHLEFTGNGNNRNNNKYNNNNNVTSKEISEAGKEITGYGVQVHDDGKVVAEYFSTASYKEIVDGKEVDKVDKAKADNAKAKGKK